MKCETDYEQIYSFNQTYMAIAMCILKEKVINHYQSAIFILPPPPPPSEIMPIYSTLGASSEHFWWNLLKSWGKQHYLSEIKCLSVEV